MTPREQVMAYNDSMLQFILIFVCAGAILYCVAMKIIKGDEITAALLFFGGCVLIGLIWYFDLWSLIGDIASSDFFNLKHG